MQTEPRRARSSEVPIAQRSNKTLSLADWLQGCGMREQALLTALAAELGLSTGRISRLIKKARRA